ncbi:hypothetical protein J6G99_06635 [bacterium]|nr:hypothetical protein [bacterium]
MNKSTTLQIRHDVEIMLRFKQYTCSTKVNSPKQQIDEEIYREVDRNYESMPNSKNTILALQSMKNLWEVTLKSFSKARMLFTISLYFSTH